MPEIETAELIAGRRYVTAQALVEGRADMRAYPYKNIAVHGFIHVMGERVQLLLSAIELMDQWGWELVSTVEINQNVYAFMRRTG
ncbi:MAG: transcriptional regulator [Hamadaea sp.]|nr:transcriptional regulator [Hamadaea sp.]